MQLDAQALPKAWLRTYQLANIGADTRKLTAADHSTPITEYDMSLHDVPTQIFTFQNFLNAKLDKIQIFLRCTEKIPSIYWFKIFSTIIYNIGKKLSYQLLLYDHEPFFLTAKYLTPTSYAARCTGRAQGLAALTPICEALVWIPAN